MTLLAFVRTLTPTVKRTRFGWQVLEFKELTVVG
jgi:hypothetical protein